MPIPDFFSPDDSVKYLKNFEENTDSYLAALDYVKERVFGEGTMLDEFNADTEFVPVSTAQNKQIYDILSHEKPVIHNIGE